MNDFWGGGAKEKNFLSFHLMISIFHKPSELVENVLFYVHSSEHGLWTINSFHRKLYDLRPGLTFTLARVNNAHSLSLIQSHSRTGRLERFPQIILILVLLSIYEFYSLSRVRHILLPLILSASSTNWIERLWFEKVSKWSVRRKKPGIWTWWE